MVLFEKSESKKKKLNTIIKLVAGLAILTLVFYKVGFTDFLSTLVKIDLLYLVLILPLVLIGFVLGAINIQILVKALGHKVNFMALLKYHILSWSIGLFVPGKLGEFSIIYFLKRKNIGVGHGLTISIIDKLLTIIVLFTASLYGFIQFLAFNQVLEILLLTALVVFLFIIFFKFRSALQKLVPKKLRSHTEDFFTNSIFLLKKEKKGLFLNLLITLVKWAELALTVKFIFLAFDTNIPFLLVFVITSTAKFISLIPITINGLGIAESMAVYLYNKVNIESSIVLSTYIFLRLVNYAIALPTIAYSLKYLSKKDAEKPNEL